MTATLKTNETIDDLAAKLIGERFLVRRFVNPGEILAGVPAGSKWFKSGAWFSIWDNGGEIGVELVNSGGLPRFTPSRIETGTVGPLTLFTRVLTLIAGGTIDYTEKDLD